MNEHETFLKEFGTAINVSYEQLKKDFDEAVAEFKGLHPDYPEQTLMDKAQNKVRSAYRRRMISPQVPFEGFIVHLEKPRDRWASYREQHLKEYLEAKKKGLQEQVIQKKLVKVELSPDGKEVVIPLCPQFTRAGIPSKLAGQPIPPIDQTMSQNVVAVSSVIGGSPKKTYGELRGQAISNNVPLGQPLSWRGINKSQTDLMYNFSSGDTEFIPSNNKELAEYVKKVGVHSIIGGFKRDKEGKLVYENGTLVPEGFFKENLVTPEIVAKWLSENLTTPPEPYNNLTIIPEALVIHMNLTPDMRGRVTVTVEDLNATPAQNAVYTCKVDFPDIIDFVQDTKVMVLARPWLPTNKEGKKNMVLLSTTLIPYEPYQRRVEVGNLSMKDIMPPVPDGQSSPSTVTSPTNSNVQRLTADPW